MEVPEAQETPTECERVGEPMPDIAGIGILLGFSAQAFISLASAIWVIFLTRYGHLGGVHTHDKGTVQYESAKKRLEMVSEMLMVGNDIQMVTGGALIVTGFVKSKTIDLYHLHLIFDTVSFVGISNCAVLICWTHMKSVGSDCQRKARRTPRHKITYLYAVLFLVLTIFLETQLDHWSLTGEELGRCYVTTGVTLPGVSHPIADKTYVAVTAVWLLIVLFGTVFSTFKLPKTLLTLSVLQFPIHLYMMLALRLANQDKLEGEESENGWDFGQTTAALLLGATLIELTQKFFEYRSFHKQLLRNPNVLPNIEECGAQSYSKAMPEGEALRIGRAIKAGMDRVRRYPDKDSYRKGATEPFAGGRGKENNDDEKRSSITKQLSSSASSLTSS